MLNVTESLRFLKLEGLPVVRTTVINSVNDLEMIFEKVGYPLVIKLNTFEHKTEKGGVVVGIKNHDEALKAFNKLSKLSKDLVVQKQVTGMELSLGIKNDPVFGQVVMFGLGGVFIELLKDVSFRVCPVNKVEARKMISELRSAELLKGYRGQQGVNLDLLAELIVNLSRIAVKSNIKALDINPLFASDSKLMIVDARLEV